jgi:hypothetical protein
MHIPKQQVQPTEHTERYMNQVHVFKKACEDLARITTIDFGTHTTKKPVKVCGYFSLRLPPLTISYTYLRPWGAYSLRTQQLSRGHIVRSLITIIVPTFPRVGNKIHVPTGAQLRHKLPLLPEMKVPLHDTPRTLTNSMVRIPTLLFFSFFLHISYTHIKRRWFAEIHTTIKTIIYKR